MIKFNIAVILILFSAALIPGADAGCCGGGTWDPSAFLNSEPGAGQPIQSGSTQGSAQDNAGANSSRNALEPDRASSYPHGEMLKPMKSVSSSDIVLDVSDDDSYNTSHIKDAIHFPASSLLDPDGSLKDIGDLAQALGDAGLSRNDSVVIYSSKESSGEAEFAFLVLSYLGQDEVRMLDGSLSDWQAAGLPFENSMNTKPAVEYRPEIRAGALAEYDYVKSGEAQIMDLRPFADFGQGRITGSSAFDPSNVIKGDKIKSAEDLSLVFSRLEREQPVVAYSSDYRQSSLVWFALQLMGYTASVYSWEDWAAHEATATQPAAALPEENATETRFTKLGRGE